MSATARALALQQQVESDPAWRLLRADGAPVVAALLAEHLMGETTRLDADDLYDRLDAELDSLRARGLSLPQTARAYVAEWRKAGYLVRRATAETRGETLELSSAGIAALRFLESRTAPPRSLTESRLANLTAQLRRLAVDTDPDATRRLERLAEERDAIDARIAAIQAGGEDALAAGRAEERLHELLAQAAEVPDDFARVRAEFEELNALLRARILETGQSQREVLDDVFRGVDLISDSDAGRSFGAFSALVLDPALGEAFEEDVRQVLGRAFASELSPAARRDLREFLATLKDRSAEIQAVITAFARGLRRYVRSQDYQQDLVLRDLIHEAQHAALAAAPHLKPFQAIGHELNLSSVAVQSVGALALHDPADLDASGDIPSHSTGVESLEALRALVRATEIDFDELAASVNSTLENAARPSVADVLAAHPATQGVASVIGLLALAADYGEIEDGLETLRWTGSDHAHRTARVPVHRFTAAVS